MMRNLYRALAGSWDTPPLRDPDEEWQRELKTKRLELEKDVFLAQMARLEAQARAQSREWGQR